MMNAHGIWLALLLPPSIIGALLLPRAEARQLGRQFLAAAALSGFVLFAWGLLDPLRPSAAVERDDRLSIGVHEILDTAIVPTIPLAIAGCLCLLTTGCRRNGPHQRKPKNESAAKPPTPGPPPRSATR